MHPNFAPCISLWANLTFGNGKLVNQTVKAQIRHRFVDDQSHRAIARMCTYQYNRMVKPGIPHSRHCNQYLSTKIHSITRAARPNPNMRNPGDRLKR